MSSSSSEVSSDELSSSSSSSSSVCVKQFCSPQGRRTPQRMSHPGATAVEMNSGGRSALPAPSAKAIVAMLLAQRTTQAQKEKTGARRKPASASASCPRVAWTCRLEEMKETVGSQEAVPVREQRSECEGRKRSAAGQGTRTEREEQRASVKAPCAPCPPPFSWSVSIGLAPSAQGVCHSHQDGAC